MKNETENKSVLNKESNKVLTVIVKNPGLGATKIQKKLRWNFIPTRALSFLRKHKFVVVDKKTVGYTVSETGAVALAGYVAPKRRKVKAKKTKTVKTAPVVAAEPEIPAAVEAPVVVEEPALAAI